MLNWILRRAGRSTKSAKVFGLRTQTPIGNRILYNRAKRSKYIDEFLTSASDEEKIDFFKDYDKIISLLHCYASVSERLLVFIDNNILEDIAKRETDRKRMQRFSSLLAALMLAQEYYMLEIFACLSPAILFEAAGKKSNLSNQEVSALLMKITLAVAEIGLVVHRVGFTTPNSLRRLFKLIHEDEKKLRKALDEVAAKKWRRDFKSESGFGIRIPFSLAEDECPTLRLRYFDPWMVKFLLMHMIEKGMYRENKEQPRARSMMLYGASTAFSILKSRVAGVEGLGDIELMTYCDLTTQTMANSPEITMALTFDRRLHDSLILRSGAGSMGASVQGGSDDVEDFSRAFAWSMRNNARRNRKSEEQMRMFARAFDEFCDEILAKHFPSEDTC
ncbi:hypothetical protein O3297_25710 [Janthinobacterium sp. SUN128]|uniref:hypothetical protein n=1 Tax=Janthinobacterium sp. SUN128 TaxID=3014790 RepID=UPI002713339F|nr:hypothetical protein [Janthinobacterium sp. SUN128]MDO8036830.1 hypothetical protein [Janthinobacterium sp. SUN128]